eukprot:jgi/Chrpa1/1928/Chrysochromulina_OHIO_Genome00010012-RA
MFSSLALASLVEEAAFTKVTTAQVLKQLNYQFTCDQYAAEYGKVYTEAEKPIRCEAFRESLAAIKAHNEQAPAASWWKGLSEHSDKLPHEFAQLKGLHRGVFHTGFAARAAIPADPAVNSFVAPDELDWRTKGVVTPVKNQGGCGSCWAFSAAETVESAYGMATLARDGKAASIPILAPQQLVDCAPNPKHCGGTGGCEGSTQPLAFDYLVMAKGHDSEADYPYKGRDGTCEDGKHTPKIGITGKVELPTNNYTSLMHALVTAGPIAISVDASWGAYEGGVFSDPKSGIHTNIDHAVQLVGYGTMGGKDYWLVRNSWGASWGEQGYIKIERFGEGKEPCGTDARPGDGFGCAGGPSTIQVCGTSGILSGSSYPTGAHLL